MADDDAELHEEVEEVEEDEFEPELAEDVDPDELDEDALDEDALEEDVFDDEIVVDDEDAFVAGDEEETDELDEELEDTPRRPAPVAKEPDEEDDDDDLLTPDDVEADLDTILKDRLVAADEGGEEDDEATEVDDPRAEPGDRLQPKRPDEQLCTNCFLLVRAKAPGCPMDDDSCPIFS